MSDRNGTYAGTEFSDVVKNRIIDYEEYEPTGTVIDDFLYQKFGLCQFYFKNVEEKDKIIPLINELIKCNMCYNIIILFSFFFILIIE